MIEDAILRANLEALPPATRLTLQAATASGNARIDLSQGFPAASVLTPAGRWARIHTSPDPIATGEALLAQIAPQADPPLMVVIGIGLGYLLDALERRTTSTMKILAVEPVPGIALAMISRRDWTGWLGSGRLTLLVGPDYAGAADAWKLLKNGASNPRVIATPLMEREFGPATATAKATVTRIVEGARANEEARRMFAGRYLLNTLTNLPIIVAESDAATLHGAFTGVPAIVAGAGPSLDANIQELRTLQNKALVIAVDTAVRPLLAGGVTPHFVVAVDPSERNARHLEELPDTRDIWFVAEGSIDPAVLPQFSGRTFTFKVSNHHPWPWLTEHGVDRGRLLAWGSVLTTAFDLACLAGCDPIVFAGADLAYTGGAVYCTNTVYEPELSRLTPDERAKKCRDLIALRQPFMLDDVHGREVLTAPQFVQFRDWLVERSHAVGNRQIINGTGAGILHGGRITQGTLASLPLAPLDEKHYELRAAIRAAWTIGATSRAAANNTLQVALASHARTAPVETWLEFGGDTASREEIVAALDAAAAGRHEPRARAHVPRLRSPLPGVLTEPESHGATEVCDDNPARVITAGAMGAYALWWALAPDLLDSGGRLKVGARFTIEVEVLRGRVGAGWLTAREDGFIDEQFTSVGDGRLVVPLAARAAPGRLVIRNASEVGPSEVIIRRMTVCVGETTRG